MINTFNVLFNKIQKDTVIKVNQKWGLTRQGKASKIVKSISEDMFKVLKILKAVIL